MSPGMASNAFLLVPTMSPTLARTTIGSALSRMLKSGGSDGARIMCPYSLVGN